MKPYCKPANTFESNETYRQFRRHSIDKVVRKIVKISTT